MGFNFSTLAIICLIIIVLIVSTTLIIVVKQSEAMNNDPIIYAAKQYNVDTCSCVTLDKQTFSFNQSNIIQQR